MPNIVVARDLLPLAGTSAFLPSLLSYIRNASNGTLPLDPVIFQAILLCILAGDKHLLLHTPEEDVGLVVRLAAWTLSTIFDLTTQRLRIKPQPEPASRFTDAASATDRSPFLRSLFLRSDTPGKFKTLGPRNEYSPSRSRKSRPTQYSRSASFPNELSFNATGIASQRPDDRLSDHQPPQVTDHRRSPSTSTFTPRSPPVLHAHTDPAPSRQRVTRPVFPHALVVSGLEHAHILDQRALARVLVEKRVILGRTLSVPISGRLAGAGRGRESLNNRSTAFDDAESQEDADYDGVWNIPEGFITIYVCPWNTRERPNIHKSLLDKFGMSTTIVVHKNVRQAMRVLPFSSGHPILHPHMHAHSNPPTPSPFHASPLPQSRTPPLTTSSLSGSYLHHHHGYRHSLITVPPLVAKELLPSDFLHSLSTRCRQTFMAPVLSIYLADLFSAARHHPQLDGTFLTARAMEDAEDLARASRVLGMDPTGSELVRNRDNVEYSYAEDDEIDDQSAQGRYDDNADEVGGRNVTISTVMDGIYPDSDARTHPLDAGTQDHQVDPEPLYVSEADIARIVPRVITHRLRVRNGPQDEVLSSAVFGATFGNYMGDRRDESVYDFRITVKDILVGILGDV